jgi:hypothetical protein
MGGTGPSDSGGEDGGGGREEEHKRGGQEGPSNYGGSMEKFRTNKVLNANNRIAIIARDPNIFIQPP